VQLFGILQITQARSVLNVGDLGGIMSSSPHRASESPEPKKALFIDADPEIRAMLVNILDPLVWSVRHAADNKAALDLVRTAHFDFILTSEKTSGKEDVDLLRRIRGIRPHTRLIILTEASTPTDVIASMREHAFSYFSRPFSLSSLADMVHAAADGPCWDDGIEVLSATPDWIRVAASCDLKTADRLIQFMHEIADLPEPEADAVAMAFRELLMNAIEHGGHFRSDQYVEISYVRAKHMVMCRVKDPGEGFTLDEIDHAAVANPQGDPARHIAYREAKGLRPGGYGVLLAQKLVDELIYDQKGSEVMLVKYLDVAPLERL
jgi:anti-sigma regulatory factor (Ser/Thr protein kinase)/ActR/RegA family two-component response regulator